MTKDEYDREKEADGLPPDAEDQVAEYVLQKHGFNVNDTDVDDAIFWKYIAPAYKELFGYEFPLPRGKDQKNK